MPELTYREALRQALREEMHRDEKVFVMGEDVAAYGGTYAVTKGLVDEFGEKRLRDTPIAESVIVGSAVGAAMSGLRPVAELMTVNFSLLALDQIVNHAAKLHYMFGGQIEVPMVIRTASGWSTGRHPFSELRKLFRLRTGLNRDRPSHATTPKGY